ncbi:MAG: ketol-acid reductoisomerase [Elusimicrobiota bacterium]
MAKIFYDGDVSLDVLKDKKVAVIGYGIQGHAQAQNLRDSGIDVLVGLREGGSSWEKARQDGFEPLNIKDACKQADFIHILIPDEVQAEVYKAEIKRYVKKGKTLGFSHGFNIHFKMIKPPADVDVVMVAPKGPGRAVRAEYKAGFGVPAIFAVYQDASGEAKQAAMAFAKALGGTKAGILETTFKEETETDLFGEQVDLCGGMAQLIKTSFEVLVEAGYQPEIAYFETLHEMKLIVDLVHAGGLKHMWKNVSNNAEYGGLTRGSKIITDKTKKVMQKSLKEIQSGRYSREFIKDYKNGFKNLHALQEKEGELLLEKIGGELRDKMLRKKEEVKAA